MRTKFKRLTAIICAFIVCLIIFLKFIYINSPERAVSFYNEINNYDNNKILKESTVNQNLKMIFSLDNHNLYIYVVNRNTLNHWKVDIRLGSNDVYEQQTNDLAWTGLEYLKEIKYKVFYWGAINNSSVKKITINNENCKIEKLKSNLYVWFHFSNKKGSNLKVIK